MQAHSEKAGKPTPKGKRIPGVLSASFLFITLFTATAAWADDTASTPLSEASAARAAGAFETAIDLLEKVLTETPGNSDALVELGFSHLAMGNLDAAEDAFRQTLDIAPDYVDATLGLGYVSFRKGHIEETIRRAEDVLAKAPDYQAASDLLTSALAAKKAADQDAFDALRPVGRPTDELSVSPGPTPVARPVRVDGPAETTTRRFFFSVGKRLGRQTDIDSTLAVEMRHANGVSLTYGLRYTERAGGDAVQANVGVFRKLGDRVFGAEIGLATGEDNLPDTSVALSFASRMTDRVGYSARLSFQHFDTADVISFAPRLTVSGSNRSTASVGVILSHSSAVRGTAAVIDARTAFEVAERTTLRLGAAYGEELDGDRMRDLRSLSIGLTREIDDDLSLTAALSSEPGRKRLDFAIVRRF